LPYWAKASVALLSAAVILAYLALGGRADGAGDEHDRSDHVTSDKARVNGLG
jgi:hypothetical protein